MRALIHRFINWMEVSPTYKTIWFLPLVFVLYVYARIKNSITERITMISNKHPHGSARFALANLVQGLKTRKPKADDNIERPEPDRIIPAAQDVFFGIVITGFLMMLAYAFMTDSMVEWIAAFLAAQDNGFTFDERFAAFTAACIALVNMVVIFGVSLTREPGGDDVVDAIGDLADEINERFAEFENRVNESLERIESEV